MASLLSRTYLAVYGFTHGENPVSISSFGGPEMDQGSGLEFKSFTEFEAQKRNRGYRGDVPSFQGSVNFQSGFLFNPDCIEFESTLDDVNMPFAGNMQPTEASLRSSFNPHYTVSGQCTYTTVEGTTVNSQSCIYNLCLGEGDCLTYYAGGPFMFDFADATGEGPGFDSFDDFKTQVDREFEIEYPSPYLQTMFADQETLPYAPPLPPAFSGTILGGIGIFDDNRNPIEGSVDVVTIAGRRRTKGIGVMREGREGREDIMGILRIIEDNRGALVQQIFVNANQELPFVESCVFQRQG